MIPDYQRFKIPGLRLALGVLPLAWLWFVLINDLRVEWTVNPQYGYGWAVPFLGVYLIWQRWQKLKPANAEMLKTETPSLETWKAAGGNQKSEIKNQPAARRQKSGFQFPGFRFQIFALALCALLYAPTRLIQEANPGWRLVSWALALEVVGTTLLFGQMAVREGWISDFQGVSTPASVRRPSISGLVFPICFFLVAVPWPSGIEGPVIQGLTRADAAITCEFMGVIGIPAIQHGNVIEVATGQVGISEACSGIRSFQATLMISLFLGELYSLNFRRRAACVLAGFAMSFTFNLVRMSVLVWVAATRGVDAIARWHDPTGVTILLACFLGLWVLGAGLGARGEAQGGRRKTNSETLKETSADNSSSIIAPSRSLQTGGHSPSTETEAGGQVSEVRAPQSESQPLSFNTRPASRFSFSAFQLSAFIFGCWLLLVEASVAGWYGWHEARLPAALQWSVQWPANKANFKDLPLPDVTREILRYDAGRSAAWQDGDQVWQVIFLQWNPGATAIHLAQNHTPEVCMTAAGHTLQALAPQVWFDVKGLRLPFLAYQVMDAAQPSFVFYCLWDDRASERGFDTQMLDYRNRLAPVRQGLRNPGQRSLEMFVTGVPDAAAAETAVRDELQQILSVPQKRDR